MQIDGHKRTVFDSAFYETFSVLAFYEAFLIETLK